MKIFVHWIVLLFVFIFKDTFFSKSVGTLLATLTR